MRLKGFIAKESKKKTFDLFSENCLCNLAVAKLVAVIIPLVLSELHLVEISSLRITNLRLHDELS